MEDMDFEEESRTIERIGALRLDISSLNKTMHLKTECDDLSEIEILWRYAQVFIQRVYDQKGVQAIRLMRILVYFATPEERIEHKIFENPNFLASIEILKDCGLIDFETAEIQLDYPHELIAVPTVRFHIRLMHQIIANDNISGGPRFVMNLLQESLRFLNDSESQIRRTIQKYFFSVWKTVLDFTPVVLEFRKIGLRFCKLYSDETEYKGLILKSMEKFLEFDTEPKFKLECIEIELEIILNDPDIPGENVLSKWQQRVPVFNDQLLTDSLSKWLQLSHSLMGRAEGNEPGELRTELFQECLRVNRIFFDHVVQKYQNQNDGTILANTLIPKTILKCLNELKLTEEMVQMLKQMLSILKAQNYVPGIFGMPTSTPMYWLEMYNMIIEFPHHDGDPNFQILKKLSAILKFVLEFIKSQVYPGSRFMGTYFEKSLDCYLKCLHKNGDFEEMLNVIREMNSIWKDVLTIERIKNYSEFQEHIFQIANLAGGDYKDKLIRESMKFVQEVLKPLLLYIKTHKPSNETVNRVAILLSYITKCSCVLDCIDESIESLTNYEDELIQTGKLMIEERIRLLNMQVEHLKQFTQNCSKPKILAHSIEFKAKKLLEGPIHNEEHSSDEEKKANVQKVQDIISYCETFN